MTARIETANNRIVVVGRFDLSDLRRLTAALHSLTTKLGYADLILDFSNCTATYPDALGAVCAQVLAAKLRGIDFRLVPPTEPRQARFFQSTNVAHLLDEDRFPASTYRGFTNMPLARFRSAEDQTRVVNKLIDALLSSLPEVERGDFAAIEWSLNEITDNVLVHSASPIGGLVQMSTFKVHRRVHFSVVDAGHGIPYTLRQGHPEIPDDATALERAVREGVTRDPAVGQGNGLFGTFEVARASGGFMHIHSGNARLSYDKDQLRYSRDDVPYRGALISACMDCSNPEVLAKALKFGDRPYSPLDYIETHFEDSARGDLVIVLADEASSFGSRLAGEPVRVKIGNLVHMNPQRRVTVDLTGVAIISSSFADEVFGKLFAALGPLKFGQALELRGISPTVRALIDKAILQRMVSKLGTA